MNVYQFRVYKLLGCRLKQGKGKRIWNKHLKAVLSSLYNKLYILIYNCFHIICHYCIVLFIRFRTTEVKMGTLIRSLAFLSVLCDGVYVFLRFREFALGAILWGAQEPLVSLSISIMVIAVISGIRGNYKVASMEKIH